MIDENIVENNSEEETKLGKRRGEKEEVEMRQSTNNVKAIARTCALSPLSFSEAGDPCEYIATGRGHQEERHQGPGRARGDQALREGCLRDLVHLPLSWRQRCAFGRVTQPPRKERINWNKLEDQHDHY